MRHALRVTAVACLAFYICRYALDDGIMAVYALFAAVAMGALSRIPAPPRRQARICLTVLPVACLLVTVGTLLAAVPWAAAVGLAVVGFTVAYAAVLGPALRGTANGLQLFYILPCFPPEAVDTLDSRLIGVVAGVCGLAAAELFLWPDPPPPRYEQRLADAAGALGERMAELSASGPFPGRGTPAAVHRALEDLRLSRLPALERPVSPWPGDSALRHAAVALRRLGTNLGWLGRCEPVEPTAAGRALLHEARRSLRRTADALAAGVEPPDCGALRQGLAAFARERTFALGASPGLWSRRAPWDVFVRHCAIHSQVFVAAVRSRTLPQGAEGVPAALFFYTQQSVGTLLRRRLRAHLSPRSVYFQGAVRTALALSLARLIVVPLDLSHGFWVLLATLTLMRGTAADTRVSLRQALTGTLCGATVAAVLLTVASGHDIVYALALPVVMSAAFCAPLVGLALTQGLFTLVVSMIFAQLARSTWHLAETRFIDVLVGAVVGTLIGTLAWPRGSGRQLLRLAREFVERSGTAVAGAVGVARGTVRPDEAAGQGEAVRRTMGLTLAAYELYQCERADPALAGMDWQSVIGVAQEMALGSQTVAARYSARGLGAPPAVGSSLDSAVLRTRAACGELAGHLAEGSPVTEAPLADGQVDGQVGAPEGFYGNGAVPPAPAGAPPRSVLGSTDIAVWLLMLTDDLRLLATRR
ncbi:FUSC family protein [Wenjunlia tyrosinilytica]|uniref:FUSC family protein n=1 Tax=Wenjunlia tyrosinilytica TaxID=1544741 RepID=UPI00166A3A6F|nr:FUSC family protein [Wenjunlia tyrosinilytica]